MASAEIRFAEGTTAIHEFGWHSWMFLYHVRTASVRAQGAREYRRSLSQNNPEMRVHEIIIYLKEL